MAILMRKDCFFGLHFDFHADDQCMTIGENTTDEMIQAIIDLVHPDFIQHDCKGHRGLCSYPTKVGNPAPGIQKDILRLWRDVTERNGVALYLHYSGVWDEEAIRRHPEWAAVGADGTAHKMATCVHSDYSGRLLIPQLCELAGDYGIDGVWIDGECWGTVRDYCDMAVEKFREKTGIADIPKNENNPCFYEYNEFCREAFREYLRYYINAVHSRYPGFQITSNWAFTTMMPERVSANVDYISGDAWGIDNINSLRFDARFMSQQKIPWDLMSWNMALIQKKETDPTGSSDYTADKPAIQLMHEASVVLAQGGAFQIYYIQERDSSIDLKKIKTAAGVANFCRKRKDHCFGAKSKAQTAILLSTHATGCQNTGVFGFWHGELDGAKGVMQALIRCRIPVDVVAECHLEEDINRYSVIIIPEWEVLSNQEQLLDFANNGGSLIVIGSKTAPLFEDALGVKIGETLTNKNIYLESSDLIYSFGKTTNICRVQRKNAVVIDTLMYGHTRKANTDIAATVNAYGKGKIAGVYFDFGAAYLNGRTTGAEDFIDKIMNAVLPDREITVEGSRNVEVVYSMLSGKTIIGLINSSGPHGDTQTLTYDEILPVGKLNITVKRKEKPKKITLQPEGREIEYDYKDGTVLFSLDGVELYDIVVME